MPLRGLTQKDVWPDDPHWRRMHSSSNNLARGWPEDQPLHLPLKFSVFGPPRTTHNGVRSSLRLPRGIGVHWLTTLTEIRWVAYTPFPGTGGSIQAKCFGVQDHQWPFSFGGIEANRDLSYS